MNFNQDEIKNKKLDTEDIEIIDLTPDRKKTSRKVVPTEHETLNSVKHSS